MNGCTPHLDAHAILVCESMTGRIFKVDLAVKAWSVWLSDSRLRPSNPQMPGANGIKLRAGYAYISVTDSNHIYRTRIEADGSCREHSLFAEYLRADDFAFSTAGSLYIATHPANSVVRLSDGGVRTTVGGASEGLVGATACAFGRGTDDARSLYVTTSGGLFAPHRGALQEAKLVRVDVGEAGASLFDRQ